jgi:hypothetical protein
VVIYEGSGLEGPINLVERLRLERRAGQQPSTPDAQPTVLVVIDQTTARAPFWRQQGATEIDSAGVYRLWRLDRRRLEASVAQLWRNGFAADWQVPRPERY